LPAGEPVIAVLPLENLSSDPALSYQGDGIAETMTAALSKIGAVVISRAVVLESIKKDRDPRRVAADLGASFLVDGSVEPAGDQLLITVRLVTPDGRVVWGDSYNGRAADSLHLRDMVTTGAVASVRDKVGGKPLTQLPSPGTSNAAALTAYWEGRSMLDRATSPERVLSAISSFQRAVALDPAFALGYAGLAEGYWQQYVQTNEPSLTQKALEAALKGLQLGSDRPAVIVAASTVYNGLGQYDEAVKMLRRAAEIEPGNEGTERALAKALLASGAIDEAVRVFQDTARANPRGWRNHYELGMAFYRLRRLPEAADALSRAIELNSTDPRLYGNLGNTFAQMGDNAQALANFERANQLVPSRMGLANIGTIRYRMGQFDDARKAFESALDLDANYYLTHYSLADTYVRLGRADDARREYQNALSLGMKALQVNPKDAEALARVAVCEAKLGRLPEATRDATTAASLAPNLPEVQYKRAVVHALAGDRAAALDALQRALSLGFSVQEARADFDLATLKGSPQFDALVGSR
jgi:tetratricopeptide (TPR) repeat protein/TolB-like protein